MTSPALQRMADNLKPLPLYLGGEPVPDPINWFGPTMIRSRPVWTGTEWEYGMVEIPSARAA